MTHTLVSCTSNLSGAASKPLVSSLCSSASSSSSGPRVGWCWNRRKMSPANGRSSATSRDFFLFPEEALEEEELVACRATRLGRKKT